MARPLRVEFAGAIYHLCGRGNARGLIFRDDLDRVRFLQLLESRRNALMELFCALF